MNGIHKVIMGKFAIFSQYKERGNNSQFFWSSIALMREAEIIFLFQFGVSSYGFDQFWCSCMTDDVTGQVACIFSQS